MTIFPPLVLITSALLQTPLSRCKYALLSKYNLKKLHTRAAKGLTETCYLTHAVQPSGLVRTMFCLSPAVRKAFLMLSLGNTTAEMFAFSIHA
ncbi:hypothetical protein BJ322DRAFT_780934 [Thelephora terrestris]|uniref:Uncharacterized protein n=1 Tax=Thelephora terrestris TaxID=56493 RepID=A0A9P6HIW7_9AGAM|nr:hypothetical protein BJ322DRAFT_780934 [Thelephora terrestris]